MKKIVSITLVLLFVLTAAFGCKPETAETTDTEKTPDVTAEQSTDTEPDVPVDLKTNVVDLRVNYEKEPICVDVDPTFSWSLDSELRGVKQTSYRIRIAESEDELKNGKLVWDSGETASDNSVNVRCGAELSEAKRYYFNVTVNTDKEGEITSYISHFDTALTETGFDGAKWITQDNSKTNTVDVQGAYWIWKLNNDSQGDIPEKTEYFRYKLSLDKDVSSAYFAYTADDYGEVYINEKRAARTAASRGWENAVVCDVTEYLTKGENIIACSAVNNQHGYGAVIFKMIIDFTDGTSLTLKTNDKWKATDKNVSDWYKKDCDESAFARVDSVIPYGENPWYSKVVVSDDKISAPTVRYSFDIGKKVASAKLFASAGGLYDAYVNGKRASADVLDPGRTEYNIRVMYQCHDVTDKLKQGENVIGAVLGRGWYIGAYAQYGATIPAFICKLVIDYEDGERQIITTDENWKFSVNGPITYNDIFNGETYNANQELTGWSEPSYNDEEWFNVSATTAGALGLGTLVPQLSGTVRIMDKVAAKEVTSPSKGVYIYDFGQNLAGYVTVKVKGESGTTVRLRHAEMLNDGNNGSDGPKGTIYTQNLRSALASDNYILKGDKNGETYTPTFTFHGFRYVEITGINEALPLSDVTANVLYSDMEDTGKLTTDDELVNQLISNTYWGQRGNFLSTPTDCPQRDERMGWSGDAQIFCGTAAYNMNVKTFFDKYITDLNDCQRSDGSYPDVAPQSGRAAYTGSGNNAWGDAGVIIPWVMYTRYGDISYIEKYYSKMKKYAMYLNSTSDKGIRARSAYGDWLSIGESTDVAVTDTAYCIHVFDIMAKIAGILGKSDDARHFSEYAETFRKAWNDRFVKSQGVLKRETQTAYLVALAFNIVPEEDAQAFADRLNEKIKRNGTKLTTGFIGCPLLLPMLCKYGHTDTAFALLQQTEYPSWKYPILQGATTIWERWNSYTIANGFGDAGMNSFNHYSYGSVTEWLYSSLAGITCDEENTGFSHFYLKPNSGGGINKVSCEYDSVRGMIKSAWTASDGVIKTYNCTVPANTTATLYLPAASAEAVTESGKPLSEAEGLKVVSSENGYLIIELSSGAFEFEIK